MEGYQTTRNEIMAQRQSRIAQANVFAAGANESGSSGGLQPSSGVAGTIAGLQTQTNVNIGFMQQMNQLTQQRYMYLGKAADRMGIANDFSQLASSSKQGLQMAQYYG